ncbi:unnamed protein product [Amoebophrya sp. A120]|nr:unnamed protein product [Amoebophrya sp. A120]|eukprot:GSA120T00016614001.1
MSLSGQQQQGEELSYMKQYFLEEAAGLFGESVFNSYILPHLKDSAPFHSFAEFEQLLKKNHACRGPPSDTDEKEAKHIAAACCGASSLRRPAFFEKNSVLTVTHRLENVLNEVIEQVDCDVKHLLNIATTSTAEQSEAASDEDFASQLLRRADQVEAFVEESVVQKLKSIHDEWEARADEADRIHREQLKALDSYPDLMREKFGPVIGSEEQTRSFASLLPMVDFQIVNCAGDVIVSGSTPCVARLPTGECSPEFDELTCQFVGLFGTTEWRELDLLVPGPEAESHEFGGVLDMNVRNTILCAIGFNTTLQACNFAKVCTEELGRVFQLPPNLGSFVPACLSSSSSDGERSCANIGEKLQQLANDSQERTCRENEAQMNVWNVPRLLDEIQRQRSDRSQGGWTEEKKWKKSHPGSFNLIYRLSGEYRMRTFDRRGASRHLSQTRRFETRTDSRLVEYKMVRCLAFTLDPFTGDVVDFGVCRLGMGTFSMNTTRELERFAFEHSPSLPTHMQCRRPVDFFFFSVEQRQRSFAEGKKRWATGSQITVISPEDWRVQNYKVLVRYINPFWDAAEDRVNESLARAATPSRLLEKIGISSDQILEDFYFFETEDEALAFVADYNTLSKICLEHAQTATFKQVTSFTSDFGRPHCPGFEYLFPKKNKQIQFDCVRLFVDELPDANSYDEEKDSSHAPIVPEDLRDPKNFGEAATWKDLVAAVFAYRLQNPDGHSVRDPIRITCTFAEPEEDHEPGDTDGAEGDQSAGEDRDSSDEELDELDEEA